MFTEAKGTEIYCMTDDFCKEFTEGFRYFKHYYKGYVCKHLTHQLNIV